MYFWNLNIYCIFFLCMYLYLLACIHWSWTVCIWICNCAPEYLGRDCVTSSNLEQPTGFFLVTLDFSQFRSIADFLFGIRIWTYSYFDILFCVNLLRLFSIETRMCYLKLVEYNFSGLILHQCCCQMQSWNQVIVCNSKDRWTNCEDYPHTALEDPDLNLWKQWREYL